MSANLARVLPTGPTVMGLPLLPAHPLRTGPFRSVLGPDWSFSEDYRAYEGQQGDTVVLALEDVHTDDSDPLKWSLVISKLDSPLTLNGFGATLQEAFNHVRENLDRLAEDTTRLQLHLFTQR